MARGFVKPREVSAERAYRNLVAAIVNRAIEDYIDGYDRKKQDGFGYDFQTAESFLHSERSNKYLNFLDIPVTGEEIIEKIKAGIITKESFKEDEKKRSKRLRQESLQRKALEENGND